MRTGCLGILLLASGGLLFWGFRAPADEKPKEKSAQERAREFVYPGAEKFELDREGALMYQAKFTTTDSPVTVAAWYGKTLGFKGREGISFNPGAQTGIRLSVADDSRQPGKDASAVGEPRPLFLKVFVKKTNDIVVVAVVSRAEGEKVTHVTLTFLDNKDQ